MRKITSFVLFLCIPVFLSAQTPRWSEVRIHAGSRGMEQLAKSGLALEEGFHAKDSTWTTILSQEELARVRQAGFPFEVLHADYSQFIEDRNRSMAGQVDYINHHKDEFKSTAVYNYPVPQHFHLGSMGGYFTLQEVLNQLDSMRLFYPGLISVKAAAGNNPTIEGRTVYYVRISNNPDQTTTKPKVFYNSLIHAREPMGMQQLVFYMWYLLENYSTSDEVKYLVDNLQLYFIPVVNPDGYEFNHAGYPSGGGMWRKNRRDNGGGNIGVDLNRNFGYKWGYDNTGSSPDPASETYRGTAPFSEPETQIIRDFSTANVWTLSQNYHTYSDYTMYPWCWQTALTADSAIDIAYSSFMVRQNGYMTGTPGQILYNTNGDALDWQYGEQTTKPKELCFTTETGTQTDGFWPFANRIIPLAQENMYSNLMIAHFAIRYAEAQDASPVILSSRQGYFNFNFVRYGMDSPANYQVTLKPLDSTQFISWGGTKSFNNPIQLQPYPDSVAYLLKPTITSGDRIGFVYEVNNGLYTFRDTVIRFFGPPLVIFSDSCNTMANWSSTKWNVTHAQYHSPTACLTDSPTGNYSNNSTVTISSANSLDLKGSPVVVINYWAKWRTEQGSDFVQFNLQGNLGPWTPQQGRYTKTSFYTEAANQPLYDGNQPTWVKEQIVTTGYTNKTLGMQFLLKSDQSVNYDGFYFDDVTVTVVDMTHVGISPAAVNRSVIGDPVPNPATGIAVVGFDLGNSGNRGNAIFILVDLKGMKIMEAPVPGDRGSITVPVENLAPGVYLYRISGSFGSTEVKKLVVIH
ncbi:MAG: M14 family zinc carboxypeptidase [Bacteroidota bacterium]